MGNDEAGALEKSDGGKRWREIMVKRWVVGSDVGMRDTSFSEMRAI